MATPTDYPMNWHTQTKIHLKEIKRRARQRKHGIPPGAIQTTRPDPTKSVIVLPPKVSQ